MTDQTKVLELAKEYLGCSECTDGTKVFSGTDEYIVAFAAALEAKHLAQIAMLRDAIEQDVKVYKIPLTAKLCEALTATQQTAEEFVARVRAEALEVITASYTPMHIHAANEALAQPLDTSALDAYVASKMVPAGWKVVPVEPTQKMIDASFMHLGVTTPTEDGHRQYIGIAWHAMLTAATPPNTQEKE